MRILTEKPDRRTGEMRCTPLRVLIVAPTLGILGGQAVQADRLISRLRQERSIEVELLPINPRLPGLLGRVQSIKYVRTILTSLAYCASLLARVHRFDVIHIFSASYFSFVLAPTPAILISKLYGKKVLLNYHSGEAADHLDRWRRTALPTLRLADQIVVPSGYLVDVFRVFGIPARAIFNTVDMSEFRFRRRVPLKPVFLSNRNLEAHYNVGLVIRAFGLIQKRFSEARLIVAGEGSQRAELEMLVRDLSIPGVEFTGAVPPGQMPALYDRADIFLNGSDVDNMPLSILEACAAGLPVVSTGAGGIPYIIEDRRTGLLVECGDCESLASRAMELLEDGGLAETIAGNAREQCHRYSWEAVGAQWVSIYNELANAPPRMQPGAAGAPASEQ